MKHAFLATCAATLAACGQATVVQEGTFTFRGETYRSITQDITTGDRTFQRRTIFVGARRVSCSATDDADCTLGVIEATKSAGDRGA
ncbi:hypothetical protein [uncultured Tateyamaria sp.]|uniref:hypothetical protein n=1 Tax=uncultured Tateyamaria sp. TaxID=455651 RepID=UPI002634AD07|nr:hypothetical protein [uncultured Tateyamaria sp.]